MLGKALPRGMLRRRKRGAGKHANRRAKKRRLVIQTWSLVFAVIVLLVIVGMVWLWLVPGSRNAVAVTARTDDTGPGRRVVSRFPSPSKEAALDLVKRALQIRDPGKVP